MIIKNSNELSSTRSRRNALYILEAGLIAVLPKTVMKSAIRYDHSSKRLMINDESYDLSLGRVFVVGGGKAAGAMAETLESIIAPDKITAGVVNCNSGIKIRNFFCYSS